MMRHGHASVIRPRIEIAISGQMAHGLPRHCSPWNDGASPVQNKAQWTNAHVYSPLILFIGRENYQVPACFDLYTFRPKLSVK
jgi:hypothetical protein